MKINLRKELLKARVLFVLLVVILVFIAFYFYNFIMKNKKVIKNGLMGTLLFIVLLAIIPYIIVGFILDHQIMKGVFILLYEFPMIYISALRVVPKVIEIMGVQNNDLIENYENEVWFTTALSLTSCFIIIMMIHSVW